MANIGPRVREIIVIPTRNPPPETPEVSPKAPERRDPAPTRAPNKAPVREKEPA